MKLALATMPAMDGKVEGRDVSEMGEWAYAQPWFKNAATQWFTREIIQKSDLVDYDSESKKWHGIYTKLPIPVPQDVAAKLDKKQKVKTSDVEFEEIAFAFPRTYDSGMPIEGISERLAKNGINIPENKLYDMLRRFVNDRRVTFTIGPDAIERYSLAGVEVE
jgi:hypothetical protein